MNPKLLIWLTRLLLLLPQSARAAVFNVTKTDDTADGVCDRDCSLREAVLEANASGGADTISLPNGVYVLDLTGPQEDAGFSGDLDVTEALALSGSGRDSTMVDGGRLAHGANADRVLHMLRGDVSLSDLTVRNGLTGDDGGGIFVQDGTLSLVNVLLTNNEAFMGGAIYKEGRGGLNLDGVGVSLNSAKRGGGIYLEAGQADITHATLRNNSASSQGGAVYSEDRMLLVNSTISGNDSLGGVGGGVFSTGSGRVSLINVTLSGNAASLGAALANDRADIMIQNTLIADGGAGDNCDGTITSNGNNIDSGSSCGLNGPSDFSNINPGLDANLQNNGGNTETHLLNPGSPAIDAGDPGACPANDQRGAARPIDGDGTGGAQCDIGAVEAPDVPPVSLCGNGVVDFGEDCDDGNRTSGDGCRADCGRVEACGDGARDSGELCDDGNAVNDDGCTNACQFPRCGDNILQAGLSEICDDGNALSGDGCSFDCRRVEACGNSIFDLGELCDDGNTADGDGCSADCSRIENCGNGILDQFESCDDGNLDHGDACPNTCRLPSCGDGILQASLGELCDDANTASGDGCTADCRKIEVCGDGIVDANEACDDGNADNADACPNTCLHPSCGDGILQESLGELCDDGNADSGDACLNTCLPARCGDGVIQAGAEPCDDGNNDDTDLCRNGCVNPVCGDGVLNKVQEVCDDGNLNNGDTCDNSCSSVVPGIILPPAVSARGSGCSLQGQSAPLSGWGNAFPMALLASTFLMYRNFYFLRKNRRVMRNMAGIPQN